ncbi:MAG: hypothetical protein ACXW3C_18980, partial [Pyrinomonadaceae bacterium]
MRKFYAVGSGVVLLLGVGVFFYLRSDRNDALHYERAETEVVISAVPDAKLTLFKAGNSLQD